MRTIISAFKKLFSFSFTYFFVNAINEHLVGGTLYVIYNFIYRDWFSRCADKYFKYGILNNTEIL